MEGTLVTWILIGVQFLLLIAMTVIVVRLTLVMVFAHKHLPFMPTSKRAQRAIEQSGALKEATQIIDLGSGTGTLLKMARTLAPQATLVGVERSRFLVFLSRISLLFTKPRPQIIRGDMFKTDISNADAIIGFWIGSLTPRLLKKFEKECAPGTIIVSNLFRLPASDHFTEQELPAGKRSVWVYKKR